MTERLGVAEGSLLTFRVAVRLDDPVIAANGFEAELLPDHRRHYLAYEGEVSGGRGRVQRVAGGWTKGANEVRGVVDSQNAVKAEAQVGKQVGKQVGEQKQGEIVRIEIVVVFEADRSRCLAYVGIPIAGRPKWWRFAARVER